MQPDDYDDFEDADYDDFEDEDYDEDYEDDEVVELGGDGLQWGSFSSDDDDDGWYYDDEDSEDEFDEAHGYSYDEE